MIEYNDRRFYYWFDHLFPVDGGIPYLNTPPMHIDDIPCPKQISRYTSDLLTSDIYVTSLKPINTLTTHSYFPQGIFLDYYDTNTYRTIIRDNTFCGRCKRGYWSGLYDGIIWSFKRYFIDPFFILTRIFITVMELLEVFKS